MDYPQTPHNYIPQQSVYPSQMNYPLANSMNGQNNWAPFATQSSNITPTSNQSIAFCKLNFITNNVIDHYVNEIDTILADAFLTNCDTSVAEYDDSTIVTLQCSTTLKDIPLSANSTISANELFPMLLYAKELQKNLNTLAPMFHELTNKNSLYTFSHGDLEDSCFVTRGMTIFSRNKSFDAIAKIINQIRHNYTDFTVTWWHPDMTQNVTGVYISLALNDDTLTISTTQKICLKKQEFCNCTNICNKIDEYFSQYNK